MIKNLCFSALLYDVKMQHFNKNIGLFSQISEFFNNFDRTFMFNIKQ